MGVVHLTGFFCFEDPFAAPGTCRDGVVLAGMQTIFTLPDGYRPAKQELFPATSYGLSDYHVGRIDVTAAGDVTITAPPNEGMSWISLSGITFRGDH